jgi:hypothetical protein
LAVFAACRELRSRDLHPISKPKRLEVRWSSTGGFEEAEPDPADGDRPRETSEP